MKWWFQNILFAFILSGILCEPIKNFVNVFPNGTKIRLCTFMEASSCFSSGNFDFLSECMDMSKINIKKRTEMINFQDKYFSEALEAFNSCLNIRLRNQTADLNKNVFMISEEMVANSEQVEQFKKEMEVFPQLDEYSTFMKTCKLFKTHICFKDTNCYLKSHYATISKLLDFCNWEVIGKIKDSPKFMDSGATLTSSHLISPKSMLYKEIERVVLVDKKAIKAPEILLNKEKNQILANLNSVSLHSVYELKKFAKLDSDFKSWFCEK